MTIEQMSILRRLANKCGLEQVTEQYKPGGYRWTDGCGNASKDDVHALKRAGFVTVTIETDGTSWGGKPIVVKITDAGRKALEEWA